MKNCYSKYGDSMLKCIVTDLDGTLLTSDKKISEDTKQVIKEYQKNHCLFVVATGRYFEGARKLFDSNFHPDYLITNNGAHIYDYRKDKFIYHNYIDEKIVRSIIKKYIFLADQITLLGEKQYIQIAEAFSDEDKILNDVSTVAIHCKKGINKEEVVSKLQDSFPQLNSYLMNHSVVNYDWIEIEPSTVNKGSAIKKVFDIEKISYQETICFGDGANDLSMFHVCGKKVAMANAVKILKKYADDLILSNDEEGIEQYLKWNKNIFLKKH